MDFSKFTSSIPSTPSGGYIILKGFSGHFRGYELNSIRMEDADPIMKWRNEQISALRQSNLLHPVNKKNILKRL